MIKLYDNYFGYPTVIKPTFCDRRGKKQSVESIVVVVRSELLQLSTVPGIEKLPRELTDNVKGKR